MKQISLSNSKRVALVDDEDYSKVNQHVWRCLRAKNTFYAVRKLRDAYGKWRTQYMHAFIMGTPKGKQTHHKNSNGLDNRKRENLIVLTPARHNQLEYRARNMNTSGYRGVVFKPRDNIWFAQIKHNQKSISVGRFETAEEAARGRDAKARELGWTEESMNFPNDPRLAPAQARRIRKDSSSRRCGVSYHKDRKQFQAYIQGRYIGLFSTADDAARARDSAARALGFPEHKMNFPL